MKFYCNQEEFIRNLNIVSKAVSVRTTIPTLKGILFKLEGNNLKMTASDMDINIEVNMDVEGKEDGSIVVPAKKFLEYIRKLPKDTVEVSTLENNINIKCLSSSSTITGIDGSEFPVIIYDKENKNKIIFDKNKLSRMIRNTSFAASVDQTKGAMLGILLEIKKDHLRTVAIDGYRMAINTEKAENDNEVDFIILARLFNEINKITSETESDDIEFYYDEKSALIENENVKISVRFLAGEFTKYNSIIPSDYGINIEINRKDFVNALERASIMSLDKNNLVKMSVKNNVLTISSNSEEGVTVEDLLIKKDGENINIGFNSRYLLDVLKVIEDDDIIIKMNTATTPCIISPVEGDKYIYLILPVRISN